MRIEIPFTGSSRAHRSSNVSAQKCVNWFPEIVRDDQGKESFRILIGTPGLELFSYISGQAVRGIHSAPNSTKFWVVLGNKFYEVLNDGTATQKGTLTTSTGPVYMDDNGTHILIVDGSATGYVYTIATGAWNGDLHATDGDFVGGNDVVFIDGYFFVIQPGTNIIQSCTAPYGTIPTTWSALDVYSTALSDAGPLISLSKLHRQLWALGDFSGQIFYNNAETNFPFARLDGVDLQIGNGARATRKELDGSLLWLAKTKDGGPFIVKTSGYQPVRISDHAIEYAMGQMSTTGDAYADTYMEEGHSFYVITFPTGNRTFAYDLASSEWHERSSNGLGRHRAYGHIFFNNYHIVGDHTTGKLYKQRLDKYDDNGDMIIRTRRCQHLKDKGNFLEIPKLTIDIETGVGLISGQGSDPQLMMRYSKDAGKTWSNERTRTIGKIGEYKKKVEFTRLGTSADWVFEISVSDPVKCNVIGAYVGDEE